MSCLSTMLSTLRVLLPTFLTSPRLLYVGHLKPNMSQTLKAPQKVTGYLPKDDGLKNAFTGCDLVVIPAGIPRMVTNRPLISHIMLTMGRKAWHDP